MHRHLTLQRCAVAAMALVLPPATAALAAGGAAAGSWRRLPAAPIAPDSGLASVWTGDAMLVFGVATSRAEDGAVLARRNVAAAYDPAGRRWRRLPAPAATGPSLGDSAVWTGDEMLVWGQGVHEAYDPAANRWRVRLPRPPGRVHDGAALVTWTGREMVGWGGGCCGDAFSDGSAYDPARNAWRRLAAAPLAGSQHPAGAWTGTQLVVLVGDRDPDGARWPARLARAAAYDPARDTWRRIAQPPVDTAGASAVWDGSEVLVVGAGRSGAALAYDPASNRWRRLPRTESHPRTGAAVVWAGDRLIVWGGAGADGSIPAHGLSYDPAANRWSALPPAPVLGRRSPTAVWTGRSVIAWGGGDAYRPASDGAAFTPTGG